jgi:hypothetical protein
MKLTTHVPSSAEVECTGLYFHILCTHLKCNLNILTIMFTDYVAPVVSDLQHTKQLTKNMWTVNSFLFACSTQLAPSFV